MTTATASILDTLDADQLRAAREKLHDNIRREGGCWVWQAGCNGAGYGMLSVGSRTTGNDRKVLAHRLAHEIHLGPIPCGLEIDHLCRNTQCVNPAHLEAVTHTENVRRGDGLGHAAAFQRAKTHCPKGHPYDADNTYVAKTGQRSCRACGRERMRRRRQADPERARALCRADYWRNREKRLASQRARAKKRGAR